MLLILLSVLTLGSCGPTQDAKNFKDQYCTDPRTLQKHAAYTEWADAYSCSRHRCQPGGRNLAIYTVGCKRVEAPESAIECEEVVEDTNMQFPYCCTRLRCLVVVRGEVWTRVLGQPWESLPAAPWSHMYKMKKPPPGDTSFLQKTEQGPIYELADEAPREKVLRSGPTGTESPEFNEVAPRAAPMPSPDIVIALSTNTDNKDKPEPRQKRRKPKIRAEVEEDHERDDAVEIEENMLQTDQPLELASDEKYMVNEYGVTQKSSQKDHRRLSWTEVPQNQWNEHDSGLDDTKRNPSQDSPYHQPDFQESPKEERSPNLQALVDAIGTRMRDIENVVQRMSEKVQHKTEEELSAEKRTAGALEPDTSHKKHKMKKSNPNGDSYKRASQYLHTDDFTTEAPIFIEDGGLNGYYSDASNSILRRSHDPKEPQTYIMAPIEANHKGRQSDTEENKKKKHRKRRKNGKHHKKHHSKDDKRKRFNKITSIEDKTLLSMEDSSGLGQK